jgi:hypothetical protein
MRSPNNLKLSTITLLSIMSLLATIPSEAKSSRELTLEFRNGFERGCNLGSTPDVSNQRGYCTCLANSYEARYSGDELSAISQYANKLGKQGAGMINLMMTPEKRACAEKY